MTSHAVQGQARPGQSTQEDPRIWRENKTVLSAATVGRGLLWELTGIGKLTRKVYLAHQCRSTGPKPYQWEQNHSEQVSTSLFLNGLWSQHWLQFLGLFLTLHTENFKIEKFHLTTASPQHVCLTQTLFFKQSLLYLIHYKIWKIVGKQQTQTGATLTRNNSGPFAKLISLKTK